MEKQTYTEEKTNGVITTEAYTKYMLSVEEAKAIGFDIAKKIYSVELNDYPALNSMQVFYIDRFGSIIQEE
ncbi:hypothetical protein KY317_01185, partial [Candidatus Woesearchaeota archaeon]|nr:hypothetical protein [Candidatus Woesearchaeota archaeon]